ncbi:hypothetical protein MLD38_028709 [Melastoma candidum]|uniref:Uncharacterized protein n=1 Tax=Melastoma candidum TaxID=119954 RepID=A0ACB9N1R5_9MYRT|nr:hypothetical protein MLD38_028709 [Melastoma candidum]
MQPKIDHFFKKPIPASANLPPPGLDDELGLWESKRHVMNQIFKRRHGKLPEFEATGDANKQSIPSGFLSPERSGGGCTVINPTNKRSYAQLHLEFGQSDFLMRSCSECGMMYSPGDDGDDKAHLEFHKKYTHGIRLKGWHNERIVDVQHSDEGGRIVLVQDCDPPAQRKKVQEVVKMMEIDLGHGWIYHRQCKVYLFVSACRIVGCLVAEPIKEAFRMISSGESVTDNRAKRKEAKARAESYPLQFGNVVLQRELATKDPSFKKRKVLDEQENGVVLCEEEAVPAICGIRAIWVTPSNSRKQVATRLIDAARISFGANGPLNHQQMAFYQFTGAGKALALSYMGNTCPLVYRVGDDRHQ